MRNLENAPDQFFWNAMFAAFNVSARNLYYFLGRREGSNANVADYRAYCQTYARGSIESVKETMTDLNAQCLHLGKTRTKEADRKINLARVRKMSEWIESNVDNLLKSFKADFRSKIVPMQPDGDQEAAIVRVLGPSGPMLAANLTTSTSSHVTFVNTGTKK
jgi:hypothetical protein